MATKKKKEKRCCILCKHYDRYAASISGLKMQCNLPVYQKASDEILTPSTLFECQFFDWRHGRVETSTIYDLPVIKIGRRKREV